VTLTGGSSRGYPGTPDDSPFETASSVVTRFQAILSVHIAAGSAGLILGPIAMSARKTSGLHTRVGEAYHWVVAVVCVSAACLASLDWGRRCWFLLIAAGVPRISTPWAWALPTGVGSPLITCVTYQVQLGRRPRL
jgi:hypothetical protein